MNQIEQMDLSNYSYKTIPHNLTTNVNDLGEVQENERNVAK